MIKKKNFIAVLICIVLFSGFSSTPVGAQNRLLIVVDVQRAFYENTQMKDQTDEMVDNINLIIERFDPQNVIYVKAASKVLEFSFLHIRALTVPAPEIDDRLKIVSSNIFTKTEGDAFTVDSLNMYLTSCNAKEIVLVGLMAEKCIYATALGGLKKGYDMYIVPEAVIGQTPEKKATAIEKMTKKGIRLLSMDEVK